MAYVPHLDRCGCEWSTGNGDDDVSAHLGDVHDGCAVVLEMLEHFGADADIESFIEPFAFDIQSSKLCVETSGCDANRLL